MCCRPWIIKGKSSCIPDGAVFESNVYVYVEYPVDSWLGDAVVRLCHGRDGAVLGVGGGSA